VGDLTKGLRCPCFFFRCLGAIFPLTGMTLLQGSSGLGRKPPKWWLFQRPEVVPSFFSFFCCSNIFIPYGTLLNRTIVAAPTFPLVASDSPPHLSSYSCPRIFVVLKDSLKRTLTGGLFLFVRTRSHRMNVEIGTCDGLIFPPPISDVVLDFPPDFNARELSFFFRPSNPIFPHQRFV